MPLVSVVMPVFNCRAFLAAAIDSVRAQTFSDFEFIVVDDGSTDGSATVIDRAATTDPRLRPIHRPNTGIVGALNDGLAVAQGEFIARMDGDDLSMPDRFTRQLRFLDANSGCVAVGSAVEFMDADGRRLKAYVPPADDAAIRHELQQGNGGALVHPAVMLRAAALREAGGYREPWKFIEDLDLYLRLASLGRLANLPDSLLRYRQHPSSTNARKAARQRELIGALLAQHGLPAPRAAVAPAVSVHEQFAWWALEGGERATARRHAVRAAATAPFHPSSWRVLHAAFSNPASP